VGPGQAPACRALNPDHAGEIPSKLAILSHAQAAADHPDMVLIGPRLSDRGQGRWKAGSAGAFFPSPSICPESYPRLKRTAPSSEPLAAELEALGHSIKRVGRDTVDYARLYTDTSQDWRHQPPPVTHAVGSWPLVRPRRAENHPEHCVTSRLSEKGSNTTDGEVLTYPARSDHAAQAAPGDTGAA